MPTDVALLLVVGGFPAHDQLTCAAADGGRVARPKKSAATTCTVPAPWHAPARVRSDYARFTVTAQL
jgi:hypothetical protein